MTTTPKRETKTVALQPTAGQRIVAELSKPDDKYSLTFLIEQVGHTADYLERLRDLLNGERAAWLEVKIGGETVEVVVNNPLVEARQLTEQLRKLLGAIHAQRAAIPLPPDQNDDLAGLE